MDIFKKKKKEFSLFNFETFSFLNYQNYSIIHGVLFVRPLMARQHRAFPSIACSLCAEIVSSLWVDYNHGK